VRESSRRGNLEKPLGKHGDCENGVERRARRNDMDSSAGSDMGRIKWSALELRENVKVVGGGEPGLQAISEKGRRKQRMTLCFGEIHKRGREKGRDCWVKLCGGG